MAHKHEHTHGAHGHALAAGNVEIRWITNVGIVINILLSAVKVVVGLWAGSLALIADGIHSLSDLVSDVAVLIGIHYGAKKPDIEHPWGHGRYETMTAAVIAAILLLVGGWMIYEAIDRIIHHETAQASWAVMIVALISVISKEWLYWATRKVAVRTNSSALFANAWHHRSDAFSSVAVVLGFIALLLGFGYGDNVAAIIVGAMIVVVGGQIFNGCLAEFTERAVDEEVVKDIGEIINAHPEIREFHKLRTRVVGREIFIDFHILVDPLLSLAQSHTISEEVTENLHKHLSVPVNMVHVEPDTPEIRRASKQ
jgi:cation diffusion facilitator family transporter